MSKVRSYTDTGEVFRIHIDHLTSDGLTVYQTVTYGPYATRGAARGNATMYLNRATSCSHKAVARIEVASTTWKEDPR